MSLEKDKRRLKRRSSEAKALERKQFRQKIINNKKKQLIGELNDREIQEQLRSVHQQTIGDDLPREIPTYRSGDLGDTSEDIG